MLDQFDQAFGYIRWKNFWEIDEEGSILLTKEFLMTLQVEEPTTGMTIHFHLFDTEHVLTERKVSNLLGCSSRCSLADEPAVCNARNFWEEICGEDVIVKYSITKIHNPTLRFLACWISLIMFPHADARCATSEDLKCLYAMVKKLRYAPVLDMVQH